MLERTPPENAYFSIDPRDDNLVPEFWEKWKKLEPIQQKVIINLWGIRQQLLDGIIDQIEGGKLAQEVKSGIESDLLSSPDYQDAYRIGRPEFSTEKLKEIKKVATGGLEPPTSCL